MALILLAGLQGIPQNLYEAARIDGAGKIACFFHITIPQLQHAILVALLFRSIDAFRSFDLLFVLTRGGPGGSTEILSLLAYKNLFQSPSACCRGWRQTAASLAQSAQQCDQVHEPGGRDLED
jgi:ABC-type sugar transport system permease subunit